MASSSPMVNGEVSRGSHPGMGQGASQVGSLEETLAQMNILIKENRELKEALKQTNLSMKERFEGLSIWREKQREEKEFLESRLQEAKERLSALSTENQELKKQLQAGQGGVCAEMEALRSQLARLQAEKSDLVAMNSELQLKAGQGSPEDSFIEIRIAEGEMNVTKDLPVRERDLSASSMSKFDMSVSRMESEEQTVSQLLQSLRKETQRRDALQLELQAARERVAELEQRESSSETSTQTSMPSQERETSAAQTQATHPEADTEAKPLQDNTPREKPVSEVDNLKAQLMTLFKDLQQTQSNLDEAESMKKNLQDRCREMDQELACLRQQLGERQRVQSENERLAVQLESMQAANKLEQRKAQEEKNNLAQLKDAYTKLFEDYNELKEERKRRESSASREEVSDLQTRLATAEQALAAKQQKIDEMKQEIFQKEQELDTISVFQAQAEVYSSDFYAERAAREKIHEEKERLAAQLEYVKKQNHQLQDEMESLGRHSMSEMQRRHLPRGAGPPGGASPHNLQAGRDIPEHACPKCDEILPDLDSLQIHIMDCII